MTAVLQPTTEAGSAAPARVRQRPDLPVVAGGLCAGLAFLVWGLPVTHGRGGRDAWVLALGLLSVLPGLLVLQPWRSIPPRQVAVAMAPALAALVVCLTAPTQWDGLDETAALAYAGGLFLVVRAFAVDSQRRCVVLVGLALVGLEQFTQAYLPWWGGGTVSRLMVGTFYWHNQFSAFMLGTGIVAGVLAVRGTGAVRLAGWLTAPWCLAALLFAGSRAGLATFVVVWTVVAALSFRDRRGRRAVLGVLLAALGVATLLTSPQLMDDSGWFTSTVQAREADQGVEGNGRARLQLWQAALRLGLDHASTGAGFDSFGGAGSARMPAGAGLSVFAHNGYLQAFSDGGLLLLGAVLLATGLPMAAALRLMSSSRRLRGNDVVGIAVPAALLALVLHTGVDFDWVYPSLVALFAILAALVPSCPGGDGLPHRRTPGQALVGVIVVLFVAAAVPAALRASALQAPAAERPAWTRAAAMGLPLSGAVDRLPATSLCKRKLTSPHPAELRHGLRCTARAAQDDPGLALLRARALVRLGQRDRALDLARTVVRRFVTDRPSVRMLYADVLRESGRAAAARRQLLALQRDLQSRGLPTDAVDQALTGS